MSRAAAQPPTADDGLRRLAVAVFAVLAVASIAAFFVAQRLKHAPTAVQQLKIDPAFYPAGGGIPHVEALSFELERGDEVTVEIVNAHGDVTATLAQRQKLPAYRTETFHWNGREGVERDRRGPSGAPAPAGEYNVRLLLARRKLELRSPTPLLLYRGGKA
ncbi:MAG: flagellar hook assembly protein FlgD [Solirubrobacteraceae bacterium]